MICNISGSFKSNWNAPILTIKDSLLEHKTQKASEKCSTLLISMQLQRRRKQQLGVQSIVCKSKRNLTARNRGSLGKSCWFTNPIIRNQQEIKAKRFSSCGQSARRLQTPQSMMEKAAPAEIFPPCGKYWSYTDSLDGRSVHFLDDATTATVSKRYLHHSTRRVELPSSLKKLNWSLTLQKYQLRPRGSGMGSYEDQTRCSSCQELQHLLLREEVTRQRSYSARFSALSPPTLT